MINSNNLHAFFCSLVSAIVVLATDTKHAVLVMVKTSYANVANNTVLPDVRYDMTPIYRENNISTIYVVVGGVIAFLATRWLGKVLDDPEAPLAIKWNAFVEWSKFKWLFKRKK